MRFPATSTARARAPSANTSSGISNSEHARNPTNPVARHAFALASTSTPVSAADASLERSLVVVVADVRAHSPVRFFPSFDVDVDDDVDEGITIITRKIPFFSSRAIVAKLPFARSFARNARPRARNVTSRASIVLFSARDIARARVSTSTPSPSSNACAEPRKRTSIISG